MGKRVRVDSDKARDVIESIGDGDTLETAAAHGGICGRTVRNWLRRGNAALHHFDATGEYESKEDEKYADWAMAFMRREAKVKRDLLALVRKGAADDPKLALILLEKRWPKEWGDGRLRQEIEALLDAVADELGHEAYERVLARIGGETARVDPGVTTH